MAQFSYLHIGDMHVSEGHMGELGPVLDFILRVASSRRVDLVVCTGDVFHKIELVSAKAVRVARWFFEELRRVVPKEVPIVVVRGTPAHDGIGGLQVLSPYVAVVDRQFDGPAEGMRQLLPAGALLEMGAVRVCFVPSLPRNLKDSLKEELIGAIREVKPAVLFTHASVSGAKLDNGAPSDLFDIEWTVDELAAMEVPVVALGHIHKPQVVHSGRPFVYYAGSVGRFYFTEPGGKYVVIGKLDLGGADISVDLEWLETGASNSFSIAPLSVDEVVRFVEENGIGERDSLLVENAHALDVNELMNQLASRFGQWVLRSVRVRQPEPARFCSLQEKWKSSSLDELVLEYVAQEYPEANLRLIEERLSQLLC